MSVRNFWVEADVDGRETTLSGGPRSKDGGMYITLKQRSEGGIAVAFKIKCYVTQDGNLVSAVFDDEGQFITSFQTGR